MEDKLFDYKPIMQNHQTKQNLTVKQTVKSTISNQMKSMINDPAIPDDVKAKGYRLHEYAATSADEKETWKKNGWPGGCKVTHRSHAKRGWIARHENDTEKENAVKGTNESASQEETERYADIEWEKWEYIKMGSVFYEASKPDFYCGTISTQEFAEAVRDKRDSTMAAISEKIFAKRLPNMVLIDRDLEFQNGQVQCV